MVFFQLLIRQPISVLDYSQTRLCPLLTLLLPEPSKSLHRAPHKIFHYRSLAYQWRQIQFKKACLHLVHHFVFNQQTKKRLHLWAVHPTPFTTATLTSFSDPMELTHSCAAPMTYVIFGPSASWHPKYSANMVQVGAVKLSPQESG